MKTQLTIQYISGKSSGEHARERGVAVLFFAVTVISGVLLGVALSERVPFPGLFADQLATPAVSLPATVREVPVLNTNILPEVAGAQSENDLARRATEEAARVAERTQASAQVATMNATINSQELLIMQITREMELIKDASVSLIALFESNCGNWKDACGAPYATDLETQNVRYAGLVERLHEAERVRTQAQEERGRFMANAE